MAVARAVGARPDWSRCPQVCGLRSAFQDLVLLPAFRLLFPLTVDGADVLDHIPAPLLLAANHASHLDTLAVLAALPTSARRRLVVAAAEDYFFRDPVTGTLIATVFNVLPFRRRGCTRGSIQRATQLCRDGWSLLVYPQGTRSSDGHMGAFKPGIGLLAGELGLPVVPVAIAGTHRALPKGRLLPRRGPVTVVFGEPQQAGRNASPTETATQLEAAVKKLLRPAK